MDSIKKTTNHTERVIPADKNALVYDETAASENTSTSNESGHVPQKTLIQNVFTELPASSEDIVGFLSAIDDSSLTWSQKGYYSELFSLKVKSLLSIREKWFGKTAIYRDMAYAVFIGIVMFACALIYPHLTSKLTRVTAFVLLQTSVIVSSILTGINQKKRNSRTQKMNSAAEKQLVIKLFNYSHPSGIPGMIQELYMDGRLDASDVWKQLENNAYLLLARALERALRSQALPVDIEDRNRLAVIVSRLSKNDHELAQRFSIASLQYLKLHPASSTKYLYSIERNAASLTVRSAASGLRNYLEANQTAHQFLLRPPRMQTADKNLLHTTDDRSKE